MDPDEANPQARRMAAVSTLARPVQHEINNLLTVVFANLELLKRTAAEGGPQRQLDRIQEAARRLDGATRALLTLLRRGTGATAACRLSDAVAGVQPMLALLLPGASGLSIEFGVEDAPVLLDRTTFEDALLALAQQAADSLPRGAGLRITVAACAEGVALAIALPVAMDLPALGVLAGFATAAGGTATASPTGLRLTLPVMPPAD
jgi:signal transduction histidine kinase